MSATTSYKEQYKRLNAEQQRAVEAIEGPVMVLAGPGTGKTQVLSMRIATILLKTQMDPWNILCLTFTESGVAAMRNRLISIIGQAAYAVRIHTFHSFCNDVIRDFPEAFSGHLKLSAASDADVLSDIERVQVWRSIVDELPAKSPLKPFGASYLYLPHLISNIQALKQEGITPKHYVKTLASIKTFTKAADPLITSFLGLSPAERSLGAVEKLQRALEKLHAKAQFPAALWVPLEKLFISLAEAPASEGVREQGKQLTQFKNNLKRWNSTLTAQFPKQQAMHTVYEAYQQKLGELSRYDYEDMIMAVVERFKTDDQLLAKYQEQFQYIVVDEYQDTNSAQNEAVRLLGSFSESPNIFVVGDDKQSVYRFQGASLENLLFFYELHKKHVQVISLTKNYRSQQTILDAATSLISHNTEGVTKYVPGATLELKSATRRKAEPLSLFAAASEDAEHYFVATKIQELLAQGVKPATIAVLYRYNKDSADLLDVMLRLKLPVRLETGENVLEDKRIQQLITLLSYIASPDRDDLLASLLHYDFWNVPPLDVLRVVQYAGREKRSLVQVLSDVSAAGVKEPEPFMKLLEHIAAWRVLALNCTLQECIDTIMKESGYLQRVMQLPDQVPLLNKINTLFTEVKKFNKSHPELSLAEFIERLQLLRQHGISLVAEPLYTTQEAVRLMTAHKAKGLEFEHVFIMRLTDHHWGNVRDWNRVPLPQGLVRHDVIAFQENNEDERRLFYVALTRAKQHIYLTYATHNQQNREQVPSLFLHELPAETIERTSTSASGEAALTRWQQLLLKRAAPVTPDIREWLASLLERYTMSVTHLNAYLACPRRFYFEHILRFPQHSNKHMAFGTAVHRALREFFTTFQRTGKIPSDASLVESFERYLEREILSQRDRDECRAIGQTMLHQYYKTYQPTFSPQVVVEYAFRSHGVAIDDLPLTGQIDKIELLSSKKGSKAEANVVDYKTGNPDTKAGALGPKGEYRRQLVFYKLLCDLSAQFPYKMVSGEIDFIQESTKTGKHVKRKFEFTKKDTDELTELIKKTWAEIKALRFLDPDSGCGECEYCVQH